MNTLSVQKKIKTFQEIRGEDIYPNDETRDTFYELVCPDNVSEMTLTQSMMAAAFYGYMLKNAGEKFGLDIINDLSISVLRDLGYFKTKEYLKKDIPIHLDARGPGDVLMATLISTSSPQYKFEFIKYDKTETIIRFFGTCRYYKIASKLGIQSHLTLPVAKPWFEGIIEELKINCSIETETKFQNTDGSCEFLLIFSSSKT